MTLFAIVHKLISFWLVTKQDVLELVSFCWLAEWSGQAVLGGAGLLVSGLGQTGLGSGPQSGGWGFGPVGPGAGACPLVGETRTWGQGQPIGGGAESQGPWLRGQGPQNLGCLSGCRSQRVLGCCPCYYPWFLISLINRN